MTPALEKQTQEETKHFKEEVNLKRESIEFLKQKYEDLDFSDITELIHPSCKVESVRLPKKVDFRNDKLNTIDNKLLKDILAVYTEAARASLFGIYYDPDNIIAIDGKRLIKINIKPDEKYIGKILRIVNHYSEMLKKDRDEYDRMLRSGASVETIEEKFMLGEKYAEIDRTFPDFDKITPNSSLLTKEIDIKKTLIKAKNMKKFSKDDQVSYGMISFELKNDEITNINIRYVEDAIVSLLKLGHEKIYIHTNTDITAAVISPDAVYSKNGDMCLLMPVISPDAVYSKNGEVSKKKEYIKPDYKNFLKAMRCHS